MDTERLDPLVRKENGQERKSATKMETEGDQSQIMIDEDKDCTRYGRRDLVNFQDRDGEKIIVEIKGDHYSQSNTDATDDSTRNTNSNSNSHSLCWRRPSTNFRKWTKETWIKLLLALTLLALICFIIIDYSFHLNYINNTLDMLTNQMTENPFLGSFYFIIIYTIFVLLCIPASVLSLTGGIVYGSAFGLWIGWGTYFGVVFLAAFTSSILAFFLGRYIFSGFIYHRFISKLKTLQAIDNVLQAKGFQVVLLLRLSPIVPFSVLNYLLALTRVSLRDYTFASIGIIPGSLLYAFIGVSTGKAISQGKEDEDDAKVTGTKSKIVEILQYIFLVVGILAMIVSLYIITVNAKKELNKILESNEDLNGDSNGNSNVKRNGDGENKKNHNRNHNQDIGQEEDKGDEEEEVGEIYQ